MPFYYRSRRRLGSGFLFNLTKTGASLTKRVGPVSINSRGRITVRTLPHMIWRLFR